MTEYIVQDTSLTAVANKIREKTGDVALLEFPDEFVSEIDRLIKIPETPSDAILFYSIQPFTVGIVNKAKNWNGALYYSVNDADWTEWDGTTELSPALNSGFYLLYLKGSGNTRITGSGGKRGFNITGSLIKCVGNFNNLLDSLSTYACEGLFKDCAGVDFDIELPFDVLTASCYSQMFSGCGSLTKAPVLPALNMASSAYFEMFSNCINLKIPPALPALSLESSCYRYMFAGCTKLLSGPALPATNLSTSCYSYMFQNCSSLTSAPSLTATNLLSSCYAYMFSGCINLTSAPALPATTCAQYCYDHMFSGCSSLINVPALPADTLDQYCYRSMFEKCTSLESLHDLPVLTLQNYCYMNMYNGCTKIKLSSSQVGDYQTAYRIPSSGTGTTATNALYTMFTGTGGTFTGTPMINVTFYTSNTIIPAS